MLWLVMQYTLSVRNTHKMELKIRMVRKHPITVITPKSIITIVITCY